MAISLKPHQVVITVTNLERSVAFYSIFGFRVTHRMNKPDGRERIALVSDAAPDFELKLFTSPHPEPIEPLGDLQKYLTTVGTRCMSLLTDDLDGLYEQLKERVRFLQPPKTGMTGCRYAFVLDPDGILLELYQRNYAAPR